VVGFTIGSREVPGKEEHLWQEMIMMMMMIIIILRHRTPGTACRKRKKWFQIPYRGFNISIVAFVALFDMGVSCTAYRVYEGSASSCQMSIINFKINSETVLFKK
jgi:hypothetical protein